MKRLFSVALISLVCSAAAVSAAASSQSSSSQGAPPQGPRMRTSPATNVSVDGSEAMFTTMCALLAAGFESNVSAANWTAFRAQMRERLRHQQGPAVEVLREFYRQHELRDPGATLSRYLW